MVRPFKYGSLAMSWTISAIFLPFVLAMAVPLAIFATITSTIAFWVLFYRASMVLVEIFFTLLVHWLPLRLSKARVEPPPSPTDLSKSVKYTASRSRRNSRSNGDGMPTSLTGLLPLRDYEGVGGWRIREGDMNRTVRQGVRGRPAQNFVFTVGDLKASERNSPESIRTPYGVQNETQQAGKDPNAGSSFTTPLTSTATSPASPEVTFEAVPADSPGIVKYTNETARPQDRTP
ncbi:hypothetical protein LTR62_006879 [Meristemomyces frigidus]|uniref:Uncharacterized protein n=1 Tax=Meristemomyces frigidus TaxID=1508187 RepID=A0AAN7YMQ0_9PEZI|nr:hypothetical protein LTR62_006879 [Meristemomyces frigidus]